MRRSLIGASALAAVVAVYLAPAPVGAQQQMPPQQEQPQQEQMPQQQQQMPEQGAPQGAAPSAAFSEAQIDAFAVAARDVTQLQQEYSTKLQTAGSAEEAAELREEATDAMTEVVEEQGLTPEEYNAILQAAQADPTLYAMIVERMRATE